MPLSPSSSTMIGSPSPVLFLLAFWLGMFSAVLTALTTNADQCHQPIPAENVTCPIGSSTLHGKIANWVGDDNDGTISCASVAMHHDTTPNDDSLSHRRHRRSSDGTKKPVLLGSPSVRRNILSSQSARRLVSELKPDSVEEKKPWGTRITAKETLLPKSRQKFELTNKKIKDFQLRLTFEVMRAETKEMMLKQKEVLKLAIYYEQTLTLFYDELNLARIKLNDAETKKLSKMGSREEEQAQKNNQEKLKKKLRQNVAELKKTKRKIKESIFNVLKLAENNKNFSFANHITHMPERVDSVLLRNLLISWEKERLYVWGRDQLRIWVTNHSAINEKDENRDQRGTRVPATKALYDHGVLHRSNVDEFKGIIHLLLVDAAFDREAREQCRELAFKVQLRNLAAIAQEMTLEEIKKYVVGPLKKFNGLTIEYDPSAHSTFENERDDFEELVLKPKNTFIQDAWHEIINTPHKLKQLLSSKESVVKAHLDELEMKEEQLKREMLHAMSREDRNKAKECIKGALFIKKFWKEVFSKKNREHMEDQKQIVYEKKVELAKAKMEDKNLHSKRRRRRHINNGEEEEEEEQVVVEEEEEEVVADGEEEQVVVDGEEGEEEQVVVDGEEGEEEQVVVEEEEEEVVGQEEEEEEQANNVDYGEPEEEEEQYQPPAAQRAQPAPVGVTSFPNGIPVDLLGGGDRSSYYNAQLYGIQVPPPGNAGNRSPSQNSTTSNRSNRSSRSAKRSMAGGVGSAQQHFRRTQSSRSDMSSSSKQGSSMLHRHGSGMPNYGRSGAASSKAPIENNNGTDDEDGILGEEGGQHHHPHHGQLQKCASQRRVDNLKGQLKEAKQELNLQKKARVESLQAWTNYERMNKSKRSLSGRPLDNLIDFYDSIDDINKKRGYNPYFEDNLNNVLTEGQPPMAQDDDGKQMIEPIDEQLEMSARELFGSGPGNSFLEMFAELSNQMTSVEIRECVDRFRWFNACSVQEQEGNIEWNGFGVQIPLHVAQTMAENTKADDEEDYAHFKRNADKQQITISRAHSLRRGSSGVVNVAARQVSQPARKSMGSQPSGAEMQQLLKRYNKPPAAGAGGSRPPSGSRNKMRPPPSPRK